jgi:hypothetical protein
LDNRAIGLNKWRDVAALAHKNAEAAAVQFAAVNKILRLATTKAATFRT